MSQGEIWADKKRSSIHLVLLRLLAGQVILVGRKWYCWN